MDAGGFDLAVSFDTGVLFRVSNDEYDGFWFTDGRFDGTSLLGLEFGARIPSTSAIAFDGDFVSHGFTNLPPIPGQGLFSRAPVADALIRTEPNGNQSVIASLDSAPNSFVSLGGAFVFEADFSLFGSDGTEAGTGPLPTFVSEANAEAGLGRDPSIFVDVSNGENVLYRSRSDDDIVSVHGNQQVFGDSLFLTDGTANGTLRLDEIGSISGSIFDVSVSGDLAFVQLDAREPFAEPPFPQPFIAQTDRQVWQIDLAGETATRLASLNTLYPGNPALPNPQTFGTGLSEPILAGDQIGFVAYGTNRFTDGFVSQSETFADFYLTPFGTEVTPASGLRLDHVPVNSEFFIFNDKLVYTVIEGASRQYFSADIETGDTTLLLETSSLRAFYAETEPFVLGDNIVFVTAQNVSNISILEIYAWDGESASVDFIGRSTGNAVGAVDTESTGRLQERTINASLLQDGDLLYFVNRDTAGLTVTDGTLAGTQDVVTGQVVDRLLGVVPFAEPVPDAIFGEAGNDTFDGTTGDDRLVGLDGDDNLRSLRGNDVLEGNDGADFLRGGIGRDTVLGGDGDDTLRGQRDGDSLSGGADNDNIKGGGGNDTLLGDLGSDFLRGGTRRDLILGGSGDDTLIGNSFDDTLIGGRGDDVLIAGGQNDILEGGEGQDRLRGGDGKDVFIFELSHGSDLIEDFDVTEDRLQLVNFGVLNENFESFLSVEDGGVRIEISPTNAIFLAGLESIDGLPDAIDFF